jgi:hypothetical protein
LLNAEAECRLPATDLTVISTMQNFILLFLLAFAFAGCDQAAGGFPKQATQPIHFTNSDTMDQREFWKLMEHASANSNGDPGEQENLLVEKLIAYTPEQITEFEKILRRYIVEADDFKVWRVAAIVAAVGCSHLSL